MSTVVENTLLRDSIDFRRLAVVRSLDLLGKTLPFSVRNSSQAVPSDYNDGDGKARVRTIAEREIFIGDSSSMSLNQIGASIASHRGQGVASDWGYRMGQMGYVALHPASIMVP